MRDLGWIAFMGAAGALSRYAVSSWTLRWFGDRLAWGTLLVNVLGSLLLGFVMEAALSTDVIPRSARVGLTAGFLGAFTTFSTFSFETMRFIEEGAWGSAASNVGANLILGMLAVWWGIGVARFWLGGA